MRTSLVYQVRTEVQPINGGYAGYLVTEDTKNGKVTQVVSCVRVTKIVGHENGAAALLKNCNLSSFTTRQ